MDLYPRRLRNLVHQEPSFDHQQDGHNLTPWRDFMDAMDHGRRTCCRDGIIPSVQCASHVGNDFLPTGKKPSVGQLQRNPILGDPEALP